MQFAVAWDAIPAMCGSSDVSPGLLDNNPEQIRNKPKISA